MPDHRHRDDLSLFLVHLTRDYEGMIARDNLISILQQGKIEARNTHCLFGPKIAKIGFSDVLKRQFRTVCLTEAPINQIRHIVCEIPGRQIKLQPFGVVFWKDILLDKGANPALYINSKAEGLKTLLLGQFDEHFREFRKYKHLKTKYGVDADAIIRYYAMINVISDRYDFSWEREWRVKGHLTFGFDEVVAVIAPDPAAFRGRVVLKGGSQLRREIARIPVISPDWSYEQLLQEMAQRIWTARNK